MKSNEYKKNLFKEDTKTKLNAFHENVSKMSSNNEIYTCINELNNILNGVASPLYKRYIDKTDRNIPYSTNILYTRM